MIFPPAATSEDPLAPAYFEDQDKTALPKLYERLYEVFEAKEVPPKYQSLVHGLTGPELRQTYYHSLRADDPDKIFQRFVKHHQYDLDKTMNALIACLGWRAKVKNVNDVILGEGDVKPNEIIDGTTPSSASEKKDAADYVSLFKKGEIYLHGHDKKNRPICWIHVGKHSSSAQSLEVFERYMLYHIETPRLMMPSMAWSTLMVFDLTGAGLRQMETAPLKSMLEFFDKNYPWGIANLVIYNAPWVFGGLWKVIKHWIPGKDATEFVTFAKNAKEMEEIIDRHSIPKSMGGDSDWQYEYTPGDIAARAAKTKDAAGRAQKLQERLDIGTKLEELNKKWGQAVNAGSDVESILKERADVIKQLRVQYWDLDPYVRARGIYDDWGSIKPQTA